MTAGDATEVFYQWQKEEAGEQDLSVAEARLAANTLHDSSSSDELEIESELESDQISKSGTGYHRSVICPFECTIQKVRPSISQTVLSFLHDLGKIWT